MKHLSVLMKSNIARTRLSLFISSLHFLLRGRNKSWNILPWPNSSFPSKYFERAFEVPVNVITQPYKNLRTEVHHCIPNGLANTQNTYMLMI